MGCCGSSTAAVAIKPLDDSENIRKQITAVLSDMSLLKQNIYKKALLQAGLAALTEARVLEINRLAAERTHLLNTRTMYCTHVAERDADDIRRACVGLGTEKGILVSIITNRTIEQIEAIDAQFQKRYNMTLLQQIRSELTSATGGFITGALSDLGKFLENRIEPQPARDARLLQDCLGNFIGASHRILIEILASRTNAELAAAMASFQTAYKRPLPEVLRKKITWKNYRDLAVKLTACQRDETFVPLDYQTAVKYANDLRVVFNAQMCCFPVNGPALNDVFAKTNFVHFENINAYYPNKNLREKVQLKCSGNYENLIMAVATERYTFLATRLHHALTGVPTDKASIARILGCLTKAQCAHLREVYGSKLPTSVVTPGTKLEDVMKKHLSGVFLDNCLHLILSCDNSVVNADRAHMSPTGNNRERGEENVEVTNVGKAAINEAVKTFDEAVIIMHGEEVLKSKGLPFPDTSVPAWDGVGAGMDENALKTLLSGHQQNMSAFQIMLKGHEDAIGALKKQYFEGASAVAELNEWKRILKLCIDALELHISERDAADVLRLCPLTNTALSKLFTPESANDSLINIICCRSREQIAHANAEFMRKNPTTMARYLKDTMNSSDFAKFLHYVVSSSMVVGPNVLYSMPYPGNIVMDVELIADATKSWKSWLVAGSTGGHDSVLLELLFCRTNDELRMLKICWFETHKNTLEEAIAQEMGMTNYNLLFQGCISGKRDESGLTGPVDDTKVASLAEGLVKEGLRSVWNAGITAPTCKQFIDMLAVGNDATLAALMKKYQELNVDANANANGNSAGKSLVDAIAVEFRDEAAVCKALTAKFSPRHKFLARCIYDSLHNSIISADRTAIVRILGRATKQEVALIASAYNELFNQSLLVALTAGLSGTPNLLKAIKTFVFEEAAGASVDASALGAVTGAGGFTPISHLSLRAPEQSTNRVPMSVVIANSSSNSRGPVTGGPPTGGTTAPTAPTAPAATPGAPAATPGAPAATPGAPAATPGAPAATPGAPVTASQERQVVQVPVQPMQGQGQPMMMQGQGQPMMMQGQGQPMMMQGQGQPMMMLGQGQHQQQQVPAQYKASNAPTGGFNAMFNQ